MEIRLEDHPFTVLGIAPTLDAAAVKRAYFEALKRHPPHADPTGFRRIRDAYEALSGSERLRAAYGAAPLDLERELQVLRDQLDAPLAQARAEGLRAANAAAGTKRLVATFSRVSLAEARRRLAGT